MIRAPIADDGPPKDPGFYDPLPIWPLVCLLVGAVIVFTLFGLSLGG